MLLIEISTPNSRFSISTVTLYHNFCFTWKFLTFLAKMTRLATKMTTGISFLLAWFSTWQFFMGFNTSSSMTLQATQMPTFKFFLAFIQTESLSSTSCFNFLLSTSTFDHNRFKTLARPVMAFHYTLMPTIKIFIALVVALWNKGSTNDRWSQWSRSTWTILRLTIYHRAFLTQTYMARLSASVFFTVQKLLTSQFTLMILWQNGVSMFTTNRIAIMLTTCLFPFANIFTSEFVLFLITMSNVALHFPRCHSAVTMLLNDDFTLWTWTVMTTERTNMAALESFLTRHSTNWNRVFTWFSEFFIPC